jgi:hypothetical protein
LYELFDPCTGLLTKSQKLGLRASNSLGFAHWRGPFASPGWVPQKVHNCRSKELCKGLEFYNSSEASLELSKMAKQTKEKGFETASKKIGDEG